MITMTAEGSTKNADRFLAKMVKGDLYSNLGPYAQRGVEALRSVTPKETGRTSEFWSYEIEVSGSSFIIWWINTNTVNGFNVAVGLQYGHGTGTGGWIQGYDYINPALRPIFDEIANKVWKEVQSA